MTRIQGQQIVAIREFNRPGDTQNPWAERMETSNEVRERYPDAESGTPPDPIVRTPVFAADEYFFVVRRVEVIPGVFAPSTPAMVLGSVIAPPGSEVMTKTPIAQLEFFPVYYASVLVP